MEPDRLKMIRVKDLEKSFAGARGEVRALRGVSFEVGKGELFTLLGPSGCGKTTTLRCIAGLEQPLSGEIRIDDKPVFSAADGTFIPPERRNIGMVFQSYAIWPHMTVFQNVAYPLAKAASRAEIGERVARILDTIEPWRFSGSVGAELERWATAAGGAGAGVGSPTAGAVVGRTPQ